MDKMLYLVISTQLELELDSLFQAFEAPDLRMLSHCSFALNINKQTSRPSLAPLPVAPGIHL